MHFHVLGVGSIGCLIAHHLRRTLPASHSVSLIHKNILDQVRFLEKGSVTIERGGKTETSSGYSHEVYNEQSRLPPTAQKIQIDVVEAAKPSTGPIQSLFVSLKAHHTLPAVQKLAPRLTPDSTVVLLQNGMGVYEKLLAEVFRNPAQRPHFILSSNTHGAFASNFYHVVHAGVGSIEFGIAPDPQGRDFEACWYDGSTPTKKKRLQLTDISTPGDTKHERYKSLHTTVAAILLLETLCTSWKPFTDIQLSMRRKLAVNAVINPLTALLDCRNGDLFKSEQARELLIQICNEISEVYRTQMVAETQAWLKDLQSHGVDTTNTATPSFPESLTSEALQAEVLRAAAVTRRNISSTLQDIRRGRHTEINFLNGYLVDIGREHGVNTPVNSALTNLVRLKGSLPLNLV